LPIILNFPLLYNTFNYVVDLGQTSNTFEITLGAYDYDMMECKDLTIIQDNIKEPEEEFLVRILRTQSHIPSGILSLLKLSTASAVITIQDTSKYSQYCPLQSLEEKSQNKTCLFLPRMSEGVLL